MTVVVLLTLVWTGICVPAWIEAAVFVRAVTFGEEMIFKRPWFSAAVRAMSRLKLFRMFAIRIAPIGVPASRGTRNWLLTELGKIRPVVLPWATSAFWLKPQLMPRLRPRLLVVSTIRDSIMTFGGAVSRVSVSWRAAGR